MQKPSLKMGFIGLGNMGAPMASLLGRAGYEVMGYDITPQEIAGISLAKDLEEAAQDKDIVVTMLPDGKAVSEVADAILSVMQKGSLHLDCSTIEVSVARKIADKATRLGLLAVDAPVSGGVGGAEAGTLTFMAGGSAEAFKRALPLFEIMGKKAVHCGESGTGQSAKICNNMILGTTMIVTCEAIALADRLGLSREKLFEVVSTSSGYSWVMNDYCPAEGIGPKSPADNGYQPGFAAELMLKDLLLAQGAASEAQASTPLGAHAADLYRVFVEEEGGRGLDFSAMLPRFTEAKRRG